MKKALLLIGSLQMLLFGEQAFAICNDATLSGHPKFGYDLQEIMLNEGDHSRIVSVMQRAIKGERMVVAAIGGSITAGANASDFKTRSYSALVYQWWTDKFGNASIEYVNAGIGATTSIYGVHRAERDLLRYDPDFTIVEFSVNDNGLGARCEESYEGLIRKILIHRPKSALLSIASVNRKLENVEERHLKICQHYGIPMLSVKRMLAPKIASRQVIWSDWSDDDVHPNDEGHAVMAGMIVDYLERCYREAVSGQKASFRKRLPAPLTANVFEHSEVRDAGNLAPAEPGGWTVVSQQGYWDHSWSADCEERPLVFKLKARSIIIGYRKNIVPTKGKLIIKVDGVQVREIDANFPNGWGNYVENESVFRDDRSREHTVELTYVGEPGEPIYVKYLLVSE